MPLFQALMHDIYWQKRPLCQGTSKSVPTEYRDNIEFTHLRLMLPSYRNQSIDLQTKWIKSTEGVCFIVGFQIDHIWSNSKNKKRRSTFYKFTSKSLCFEFESQTFNPWLVPSFFPFFKFACNKKNFAVANVFFLLLLLVCAFRLTLKIFLRMFYWLLPRICVTSPGKISLHSLENVCITDVLFIWNFVCDSMTCHVL